MNVLVSGATGHTGQRLVPQLIEAGHSPIALVRDSSDTSTLPAGCTTRKGDDQDEGPPPPGLHRRRARSRSRTRRK